MENDSFFPSDEKLLELLRENDKQAFTAIYDRYHKLLYVFAYQYLKDVDRTSDAVQNVFLKLWEARTFTNVSISLRNYLCTMMKNHVLNEIRNYTSALEKNYEIALGRSEFEDEILEMLERKEMYAHVYAAINKLPAQKRKICLLKMDEGLSNQDISERLNISIPTVKTHYAQAIQILKRKLGKLYFWLLLILLS